jgi:hypothetical protein
MTDYEAAFWKLQNNWHESVRHYEARIKELEAALEKIAQHDMQAIAMDALRPGERIREKDND